MSTALDPGIVRRLADMHAVYRMYDHGGLLLYIGMSGRAGRRFDEHAVKRWFPLVASITLEWHDTEASARVSERRAIEAERPRYNIVGMPRQRRPALTVAPAQPEPQPQPQPEPSRDVLADVLSVFDGATGLHWLTLAGRLEQKFPGRWADATKLAVSAECRALGVRSVDVRKPGASSAPILKGCRRADVEKVAARRFLAS